MPPSKPERTLRKREPKTYKGHDGADFEDQVRLL